MICDVNIDSDWYTVPELHSRTFTCEATSCFHE